VTDSNTTGAPGAHQDIRAFSERFGAEGWPAIGETFVRGERVFVVTGRGHVGVVPVVTVWGTCVVCDEHFETAINWHPPSHPAASCPLHRIAPHRPYQSKAADPDAPRRKRKKKKKEGPREPTFGRFEEIVLGVVDELSLVYTDIDLDMLLRRAKDLIEAPPAAERDTRRQQCLRAVYSVAKKKGWDVAGGVLYVTEEQIA
jgi:hypothetical protein